jgi:hypothetical protein
MCLGLSGLRQNGSWVLEHKGGRSSGRYRLRGRLGYTAGSTNSVFTELRKGDKSELIDTAQL